MGSAWIDTMAVDNAHELFWILDIFPQVKGVVWGHVHQEFCLRRGAMQLMATPSTCVQFKPQTPEFSVDLSPPGCRVFELFPDGSMHSDCLRLTDTPMGLQVASAGY
jgi:Icc protein